MQVAEKDMATKTLESHNSVFADIVNCLLFDGKPVIDENNLTPAAKNLLCSSICKILIKTRNRSIRLTEKSEVRRGMFLSFG